MPKLYYLSDEKTLNGRVAAKKFGNRILFEAPDDFDHDKMFAFAKTYVDTIKPILVTDVSIYTVTITPVNAPGSTNNKRNRHMTRYFEDKGTKAMAANTSVQQLENCAHFVKYSTGGVAGEILFRGVAGEKEYDTDEEGLLVMPTGEILAAYNTAETALLKIFKDLGARGMVLPGDKLNDAGDFNTLAGFTTTSREVKKLQFDGLTTRQKTKASKSTEADRKDLLRRDISDLRRFLAEAKRAGAGTIDPEDVETLKEMGGKIYAHYDSNLRLRAKIPASLKVYIKKENI